MARFEVWLTTQRALIDSGAPCSKIVLEGPDGSVWGTWMASHPDLEQSIEGILGSLRNQLPKGKHAAKLVALATDGSQLSVFPLTIAGDNTDAAEGAQAQLHQQRANALLISNFERAFAGLGKMLNYSTEITNQQIEGNRRLLERLESVERRFSGDRIDEMREAGKQERLTAVVESLKPTLDIAMALASEFVAGWLQSKENAKKALPESTPTAPQAVSVAPSMAESVNGEPRQTGSDEPASSCSAGGDSSPRDIASDGKGCTEADDRIRVGGDWSQASTADKPRSRRPKPRNVHANLARKGKAKP